MGALRVFVALAVQPAVVALLAFALFPLVDVTGRPLYRGRPADPLDAAVAFAAGAGVVGLLMTVFGALPALIWSLQRGPVTRRRVLLGGAVLGNVPGVLIVLLLAMSRLARGEAPSFDNLTYGPIGALRALVTASLLGLASAGVFWWLAGSQLADLTRRRESHAESAP